METITTVKEYQECIDKVKKSKVSVKVKIKMSEEEAEKVKTELNMEGVDVVVYGDYDEIKPLK